jgi:hypothetical protein
MERTHENTQRLAERMVARVLDRHIRGPEGFGAERLADLVGAGRSTVQKHCADETSPSLASVIQYVTAIKTEDPERAFDLWRDFSALVGMDARLQPQTSSAESVLALGLRVPAEAGELMAALAAATHPSSPGGIEIVPSEMPSLLAETRDVLRVSCMLEAAATGVPTPQLAMAGVR